MSSILPAGWRRPGSSLADSLAEALREAVLDGRIRVGDRLPAERRMAAELGVSRGTVTAALARLRAAGWLATRHGSASTMRLPPDVGERFAPLSADRPGAPLDLRRAVPAAPGEVYADAVRRALDRSARIFLEGGEPGQGLPELREAIARRYTGQGLATLPDQILVTSGARAALALLAGSLGRGRVAAVENPAYADTLAVLRRSGVRIAPLRVTTEGWDPGQLAAAFREAAGGLALLVPDFQNPTGALMDAGTRREVAELAARHRVTVIADETMRDMDLRDDPRPEPRIRRAVCVGSLSKTVWGGLRIGWIRGSAGLVRELLLDPLCGPCTPAPMEQLVACELLPRIEPVLARRRAELREQRDHLVRLLDGDDAWTFTVPQGGLALWLRLTGTSGDALVRRAASLGLGLLAGSAFSVDGTPVDRVRLPYTVPAGTLDRAVALLREAMDDRHGGGQGASGRDR
ncbi:PLP-dependent aminotransferase family protein [Planomonospora sp. ID82291]|uniref:aminotransferase-like domain-containing protein n=1 Tax=Planomonospora sp. ID82291 TaxID=2738136 RepID=UPI0018C393CB|nr:PLP-dependent aminotransferase family protein [Planomonospora sp. ID82291]MBG0812729.1 PLP-dependent aminotransferase family protein [Planomonospora sp. ID82291]